MAAYSTGASWSFPDHIGDKSERQAATDINQPEHGVEESTGARSLEQEPTPEAGFSASSGSTEQDTDRQQERQAQQEDGTGRYWRPRTCRICLDTVLPTFVPPSRALPGFLAGRPRVIYTSLPEDGGRLIHPCKCKGSQMYVHEGCLDLWRCQNPLEKRNWYHCPTCTYEYRLQRLTWGRWLGSTAAQLALTFSIFTLAMFGLGFVADPIINFYLDPYDTLASAGGPTGSLVFEDEAAGWTEHFVKGLASLGLLGFAKFLLTVSPFQWWNMRSSGIIGGSNVGRSGVGGTGRDRARDLSWIAIVIGILTFLWAVWKGVRAWSRRTLQSMREKVVDVGDDDPDNDNEETEAAAEDAS